MRAITMNKVIDDFNRLSLEDKEYLAKIIEKQLIESRREDLSRRARKAISNLKKGKVKRGTVQDLYKDLELD